MSHRFSWIIPNRLAVGSFPKLDQEITYLSRVGITSILCLTEPRELQVPQDIYHRFVWKNVAIPDGATGGIPKVEHFQQACNILARWHKKNHSIYVHCLAGVGRSPSICALHLTQVEGISLEEAIAKVKERHPYANPDPAQIAVMKEFLASREQNQVLSNQ